MKRVGNFVAVLAFAWGGMSLPASATFNRCKIFIGTADAIIKSNAVESSVQALREVIDKWKAENSVNGAAREIAEKPTPVPYWRSEVSLDLFLPPDVVTETSYTLCWKGVVSPVVCSSGTKLCW